MWTSEPLVFLPEASDCWCSTVFIWFSESFLHVSGTLPINSSLPRREGWCNHDWVANIPDKSISVDFKRNSHWYWLKNILEIYVINLFNIKRQDIMIYIFYFDFTCGVKNPKYIFTHPQYKFTRYLYMLKYSIKQYRATSL